MSNCNIDKEKYSCYIYDVMDRKGADYVWRKEAIVGTAATIAGHGRYPRAI